MNSFVPAASRATAVGYQPVGMRPRTAFPDRLSGSTTATAFSAALATNSVRPSGLTVTAFGELPRTGLRPGPTLPTCSVFATASVVVSMTDTVSLLALVTYSRSPEGLRAMPQGWSPTSMVLTTVFVTVSITETVPLTGMPVRSSTTTGNMPSVTSPASGILPPQLLTYTLLPSADITAVYG